MGPVINEGAQKSILDYIEIGKKEGRADRWRRSKAPGDGYFVQPTVIADVDSKARIFQEEIFGPVLAVAKARDFDHALELANDSEYGLTGAVFTKNPREDSQGPRAVLRGQSLYQPQMHRRHGGRASFRRIQHVGNGFKGGRSGLLAAVPAGQVHRREGLSRQVC